MSEATRDFFQASEVARLIGMPERRLIKFVESPGYGVRPSVRVGAGKGAPRLYSQTDVLSIALAWWLFQSGFRSEVIGQVLGHSRVATILAASSEWKPETANDIYLVVRRQMESKETPYEDVFEVTLENALAVIKQSSGWSGFQILPIGSLLSRVWKNLRAME
jgi:hypothetical protein